MPCCASPPKTFCQEKVTTSSLSKGSGWAKAALVASQSGRAVPGEDHIARKIDLREVGEIAIGRFQHAHVGKLELLYDIGRPAEPKALPGQNIDAARAEHRPERHFHGPGVGGRNDSDPVIRWHLEQTPRLVDGAFQARFRRL